MLIPNLAQVGASFAKRGKHAMLLCRVALGKVRLTLPFVCRAMAPASTRYATTPAVAVTCMQQRSAISRGASWSCKTVHIFMA